MRTGLLTIAVGLSSFGACASAVPAPSEEGCDVERVEGTCEATVTLNPREPEDPQEATSLIVRWEWQGATPADVPDRTRVSHLTWREASSRASNIDDAGKSRCVIEVGTAPPRCVGKKAIVFVEADP